MCLDIQCDKNFRSLCRNQTGPGMLDKSKGESSTWHDRLSKTQSPVYRFEVQLIPLPPQQRKTKEKNLPLTINILFTF